MTDLDHLCSCWTLTVMTSPPRVFVTVTGPDGPISVSGLNRHEAVNAARAVILQDREAQRDVLAPEAGAA
jgi:hypothetical protein